MTTSALDSSVQTEIEGLPEGWAVARVTELAELARGVSYSKGEASVEPGSGLVCLLRANNIGDGILLNDLQYVPAERVNTAQRLRPGDVLLAMSSGSKAVVGKAASITESINAAFGAFCGVLRPTVELNAQYFGYFFQTKSYRDEVSAASAGVNINNLKREHFDAVELPLAPLAEQKRIVAKVEALLARVNAARAKLARVPQILKRFRQAVLAAACSGRLTEDWRVSRPDDLSVENDLERLRARRTIVKTRRGVPTSVDRPAELEQIDLPKTWALLSAAELIHLGALIDLKDGNHGSNHPRRKDFTSNGLPFITAAQVRGYAIDYANAPKVAGEALDRLRVGFARQGDAILTHKGTVGRAALCTTDCVLTPQTTYYRCNSEVLLAKYLVYYFTASQFYNQLAAVMSQTTRDFVPISEQYLLFHILPPIAEQHEIVRRIDSLFSLADSIERRITLATKRADGLTQATLAKAFRGELVPTEAELARQDGRNYEPASVLLERICAERAAQESAGTPQRRRPRGRQVSGGRNHQQTMPAADADDAVAAPDIVSANGRPAQLQLELVPKKDRHRETDRTAPSAGYHALDDTDTDEMMAAFRTSCWGDGEMTQDELLRAVASQFGYERVGKEIRGRLKNHLRAAIRRKVIARNGQYVYCPTKIFRNYDRADLVRAVRAVMRPGVEFNREDVALAVARYLGYSQLSSGIRAGLKSIFNGMLRRGMLDRRGSNAIMRTS